MNDYHEPTKKQSSDLTKSNEQFMAHVWPRLKQEVTAFKDSTLLNLELNLTHLARVLDIEGGIDYIICSSGKGARGLSSRIQWCNQSYNSFTIRSERPKSGFQTELEKKNRDNTFIVAGMTIQSYINPDTDKLISSGLIRTEELNRFLEEHPEKIHKRSNTDGSSNFIFVYWQDIIELGYSMKVITNDQ